MFKATLYLLALIFVFLTQEMSATEYVCNRTNPCGCSNQAVVARRAEGSQPALQNTWSWVVSIRDPNGYLCSGSILNEWFVITAAHCLEKRAHSLSNITICADVNRLSDPCRHHHAVSTVTDHPSYNNRALENNIALILVSVPFNFNNLSIARICLPDASNDYGYPTNGTDVVALGWGKTTTNHRSDMLQQVIVQVVDKFTNVCKSVAKNQSSTVCIWNRKR